MYEPSAATVTVPWAGSVALAYVRGSPSTSLAVTESDSAVSSAVVGVALSATGASLTDVTVMVTVAAAESTVPSLAVKVKLSVPW